MARPLSSRSLLVHVMIDRLSDDWRRCRQGVVGAALVAALGQPQGLPLRRHSILLPASPFFRIMKDMEVHFNSNLEARLTQRATQQGRKPDEFVQDVVARYLDEEDRFVAAVKRGEDALEHGEYLTHEQVGERLRRFLQP